MNYLICQDFVKILSNEKQYVELELLGGNSTSSPSYFGSMITLKLFNSSQSNKDKYKLICELIDLFNNYELGEILYSDELVNQFMNEYIKDKSIRFDDVLILKITNILKSPVYEIYKLCSSNIEGKSSAKLKNKNSSIFISKPNEK
jgi:hypothetical protein